MSNIIIEKVTDVHQFELLKEVWNNLLKKSNDNNIYITWEWLFTWWKHYGQDKIINILLIKDNNKIIGIVPLMLSKYRIGIIEYQVLENICSLNCDYGGIILSERVEESVIALIKYLNKIVNKDNIIVRISQLPENSIFNSLLQKQFLLTTNSMILLEKITAACPYLRLPTTWDEYYKSISRKRRGNLRRAFQSLQNNHVIEFKKHKEGECIAEQMQRLFDLHKKRWEFLKLNSRFSKKKEKEFCIDVSEVFSQNGWLDLSFLTIDGKIVSAVWGFIYNNNFYYMTPAFDIDYSAYSIGNLHILKLIERTIKNGMRCFDFLRGDEVYKQYWTHSANNNLQIVLMKRKIASRLRFIIFNTVLRFDQISKRSLRENYHMYLDKRKQDKAIKTFRMKDNSLSEN